MIRTRSFRQAVLYVNLNLQLCNMFARFTVDKGWKRRVPADKLEEAKEWAEGLSNFFLPQVAKFKAVGVANPEASEDPEQTDVEEEDEPIFSQKQKTPPRTSA